LLISKTVNDRHVVTVSCLCEVITDDHQQTAKGDERGCLSCQWHWQIWQ